MCKCETKQAREHCELHRAHGKEEPRCKSTIAIPAGDERCNHENKRSHCRKWSPYKLVPRCVESRWTVTKKQRFVRSKRQGGPQDDEEYPGKSDESIVQSLLIGPRSPISPFRNHSPVASCVHLKAQASEPFQGPCATPDRRSRFPWRWRNAGTNPRERFRRRSSSSSSPQIRRSSIGPLDKHFPTLDDQSRYRFHEYRRGRTSCSPPRRSTKTSTKVERSQRLVPGSRCNSNLQCVRSVRLYLLSSNSCPPETAIGCRVLVQSSCFHYPRCETSHAL